MSHGDSVFLPLSTHSVAGRLSLRVHPAGEDLCAEANHSSARVLLDERQVVHVRLRQIAVLVQQVFASHVRLAMVRLLVHHHSQVPKLLSEVLARESLLALQGNVKSTHGHMGGPELEEFFSEESNVE